MSWQQEWIFLREMASHHLFEAELWCAPMQQPMNKLRMRAPHLHHLIQSPTHWWYKWPGYSLAKEEGALYPKSGTPKGNAFCMCQNSLMFGISLRSMLSWFHDAQRTGDCGSAISGAFLIKLWFNSVFGCWWEHKIPLLPINTDPEICRKPTLPAECPL